MKSTLLIASILACAALAACTSTGTQSPATTAANLQQIAATQCPIINGALTTLTSLQGLPAATATSLAAAAAANQTVCKDVSTVNAASIQTLLTSVVPIILDAAKSAGLAAAQQNDIVLAIGAAQTVMQVAIAEQQLNAPAPAATAK